MMATSGEHEPRVIGWASYDDLRETVAVAGASVGSGAKRIWPGTVDVS